MFGRLRLDPVIVTNLKSGGRFLDLAERLQHTLNTVDRGNPVSVALGVATAAKQVLDQFLPEVNTHDWLLAKGFKLVRTNIGSFLCERLAKSSLPRQDVSLGEHVRITFWAEDTIAAVYENDGVVAGPYIRDGVNLTNTISEIVWESGNDLLVTGKLDVYGDTSFGLTEMSDPGFYLGEPSVDQITHRLSHYEGQCRAVLLVAPSGSGKSTLARLVARRVGGRVLKLSFSALNSPSSDILDLVEYLKPRVVLLDDLQGILDTASLQRPGFSFVANSEQYSDFLGLLESLHAKCDLIIATLMLRGEPEKTREARFEGMRPGRIDDIIWIPRPSAEQRTRILRHYLDPKLQLPEGIAEATKNFTGAYLMEVAHRLNTFGVAQWKEEVRSVSLSVPQKRDIDLEDLIAERVRDQVQKILEEAGMEIVDDEEVPSTQELQGDDGEE